MLKCRRYGVMRNSQSKAQVTSFPIRHVRKYQKSNTGKPLIMFEPFRTQCEGCVPLTVNYCLPTYGRAWRPIRVPPVRCLPCSLSRATGWTCCKSASRTFWFYSQSHLCCHCTVCTNTVCNWWENKTGLLRSSEKLELLCI